ncbi:ATP-binding protein [Brevibacillus choshinensis]|uniref:histidine kinase n=1 Tax=Brevibacillus choshinensis TaxID=54911 RepID=A0ABX7FQZ2_BRECH|nr:ATP-binding protein [Brevibacillus choshinensis]QRG68099.1 PAS domain S-box protein [Brevibacillus choshinensis]
MRTSTDVHQFLSTYPFGFLFDHHTEAVCVMDPLGNLCYVNPSATHWFGIHNNEWSLTHFQDRIVPDEIETFPYYFKRAVLGESSEFEITVHNESNQEVELLVKAVPLELDGQTVGVTIYMRDITALKKKEAEALHSSRELCKSFIEHNRDPIMLLDLEFTIVFANSAFSRLLGWSKSSLEGFHILQCPSIPPNLVKQMSDYFQHVIAFEKPAHAEDAARLELLDTIRITDAGQEYQMILSITPIYDASGHICNWAVHLRNNTDKMVLEKQLEQLLFEQQLNTELEKIEHLQTVSHLAASISHEVRNPLTVTRGFIQLLRDPALSQGKKLMYIDLSLKELDRAEHIISDYLTFAKPSMESDVSLNVNKELDYIIQVIHPFASMRNIALHIKKANQELHIWGDRQKLHQALINLMKNGIEAIEGNGDLMITLQVIDGNITIIIEDTGNGMDQEQLQSLGTPFFTTKEKGTGLGTMVAFSLIRAMQGEIDVKSECGKGTRFTISFPPLS